MSEPKVKFLDDDLEIVFQDELRNGNTVRRYFFVCVCGEKELMFANHCLACNTCGKRHSYLAYIKAQERTAKIINSEDLRGKVKQWIPVAPKEIVVINGMTREVTTKERTNRQIDRKKVRAIITCTGGCGRRFEWLEGHFEDGISPPTLTIEDKEICYDCLRLKVKASTI